MCTSKRLDTEPCVCVSVYIYFYHWKKPETETYERERHTWAGGYIERKADRHESKEGRGVIWMQRGGEGWGEEKRGENQQ